MSLEVQGDIQHQTYSRGHPAEADGDVVLVGVRVLDGEPGDHVTDLGDGDDDSYDGEDGGNGDDDELVLDDQLNIEIMTNITMILIAVITSIYCKVTI